MDIKTRRFWIVAESEDGGKAGLSRSQGRYRELCSRNLGAQLYSLRFAIRGIQEGPFAARFVKYVGSLSQEAFDVLLYSWGHGIGRISVARREGE